METDRAGTERRWHAMLREQSTSGLSLAAFAAQQGIAVNTLRYWKYRRAKRTPIFEEIRVVADAHKNAVSVPVELVLRGGLVVRVRENFDAALLRRLVAALEPAC